MYKYKKYSMGVETREKVFIIYSLDGDFANKEVIGELKKRSRAIKKFLIQYDRHPFKSFYNRSSTPELF